MHFHLHPDLTSLPEWKRTLYTLCLVAGILGLTLFTFAVLVETITAPGASLGHWRTCWVLLPIAYTLWHIVREIPAWGHIRLKRWAFFFASTGSLAVHTWTVMADPTARLVFAAMGAISATLIAAARLIARHAGPPRPGCF